VHRRKTVDRVLSVLTETMRQTSFRSRKEISSLKGALFELTILWTS